MTERTKYQPLTAVTAELGQHILVYDWSVRAAVPTNKKEADPNGSTKNQWIIVQSGKQTGSHQRPVHTSQNHPLVPSADVTSLKGHKLIQQRETIFIWPKIASRKKAKKGTRSHHSGSCQLGFRFNGPLKARHHEFSGSRVQFRVSFSVYVCVCLSVCTVCVIPIIHRHHNSKIAVYDKLFFNDWCAFEKKNESIW